MADEDTIQPTPRNGALGALSDALDWARTQANKLPTVFDQDSMIGRRFGPGALGNLFLGQSPEALNRLSYGNAPMRMPPAGTGGYVPDFSRTLSVDAAGNRVPGDNSTESTAGPLSDLAFAGQSALPLAKALGAGAGRGVAQLIDRGMSGQGALGKVLAPVAPAYVVKPKGGNFDSSSVDYYLDNIGAYGDVTPTTTPTGTWANTQLRNYLTKQMGSPSDPLLEVQKDLPNLHFSEPGALAQQATPMSVLKRHYEMTGNKDLTPWDAVTGEAIHTLSLPRYQQKLVARGEVTPDWITNTPADKYASTKVHTLNADETDGLGFDHVLDYLNAAQEPHKAIGDWVNGNNIAMKNSPNHVPMDPTELYNEIVASGGENMSPLRNDDVQRWQAMHQAGLNLTPEQVARTSVADAVKKTAAWNEHLASQMNDATPELARGIQSVHKEYPEDGMRWVKLGMGDTTQLPEGVPLKQTQTGWVAGNPDHGLATGQVFPSQEEATADYAKRHQENELRSGLNAEGKAMGHCVGGYCDQVANAGTQIYSLRDAKNNPHVTVEVSPGKTKAQDVWNELNPAQQYEAARKYPGVDWENLSSGASQGLGYEGPRGALSKDYPEAAAAAASKASPDIQQIKGKQNAAPVAKYLPHVQDFVKSGQWGKIGDLQNTGLMQNTFNVGWYTGPRPVDFPPSLYSEGDVRKTMEGFPEEHIQEVMRTLKGRGYKKGGSVNSFSAPNGVPKYSKKAALLARLHRN